MNKYGILGVTLWALGMLLGIALHETILFLVGWGLQMILITIGMVSEDIKNATR